MKKLKVILYIAFFMLVAFIGSGLFIKYYKTNDNVTSDDSQILSSNDENAQLTNVFFEDDKQSESDVTDDTSADSEVENSDVDEINEADISDSEEISAEDDAGKIESTVVSEKDDATVQDEPVYVPVSGISLSEYEVSLQVGKSRMPIVTMYPANATNKGEIWQTTDNSVATVDIYGNITALSSGQCTVTVISKDNKDICATVNVVVKENVECTYIDGILVVNKTYPLPKDYAPGWDAEASAKLNEMFAAAKNEGISLWVLSGYRSYTDQYIIYNNYVAADGQQEADRYSARPGHSEHQSGLAFDLNSLKQDFGDSPEGIWLAENCYKYGFIIRYPKEKESITGYMYEPWHVRYLGVEKAKEVFDSGLCLEEFLGITSRYS